MKKRTQKELKPMIKADVDAFVAELLNKYPEILQTSLEGYAEKEIGYGFEEIKYFGKILTNKERWTD